MKTVITLLLLSAAFALGSESKWVLNYKRLSTRAIAISCVGGGDPTGIKHDDILIIDCGK